MLQAEINVKAARQILQQVLAIHHSYRVTKYDYGGPGRRWQRWRWQSITANKAAAPFFFELHLRRRRSRRRRHRTLSLARFWHPALEDSPVDVASQPRPAFLMHLESCSYNFVDGLDE